MDVLKKVPVREREPKVGAANFEGVCLRYNKEETMEETSRCLKCKSAKCMGGYPVSVNIPGFIKKVEFGNFEGTAKVITQFSALPTACSRICPQETQCEGKCIRDIKGEPVSIGKLERFVADWSRGSGLVPATPEKVSREKVIAIGSGLAGLTCADDLVRLGYEVTIFEALYEPGGVLIYDIPKFRLPKSTVIKTRVKNVKRLRIKTETDVIVGKSVVIDELMDKEGFEAVFVGSSAGLPMFMGIPGESANGVFFTNEYLIRSNLMKVFRNDYDAPIAVSKKVTVVGGGGVAMDAARTTLRLDAEVYIVYRRNEAKLPARAEGVHYAKEEGIIFSLLYNPVEIPTDDSSWVNGMKCIRTKLGEPDTSGRRKPVETPGPELTTNVDTVVMSLGASPNPLISFTARGLGTNRRKCIVADESDGRASREGVFAGGDAVIEAATVILVMEAGHAGARGIDEYLSARK